MHVKLYFKLALLAYVIDTKILLTLCIWDTFTNSEDLDAILHNAAFQQGLRGMII